LSASTINTLHSEGLSNGAIGRLKGDEGNHQVGQLFTWLGHIISDDKRIGRLSQQELHKKYLLTPNAPEVGVND
jgi:hypothetical protein